jgi:hypothetical protein
MPLADRAAGTYYSPSFDVPGGYNTRIRIYQIIRSLGASGTQDCTLEDGPGTNAGAAGTAAGDFVTSNVTISQQAVAGITAGTSTTFGKTVRVKLVVGTNNVNSEIWIVVR